MRLIVVSLFATGCQLVFDQLEPERLDSGPADAPSVLTITSIEFLDPPPFMITEDHLVTATFAGDDRPVHYRWTAGIGQTDVTDDVVTLADGIGTASATWTAPTTFARGRVQLEASYEPDFATSVVATANVAAHDQFGILTTQGTAGISTSQLVATPVTIPAPGVAVNFGVKATGMGLLTVGIYSDAGSVPGTLLAIGEQPLMVDRTLDFETIGFSTPVPVSDRVWLAVLAKPMGTIQLANAPNLNPPRSVIADGTMLATLPATFPTSTANPDHYGMLVTVTAPP